MVGADDFAAVSPGFANGGKVIFRIDEVPCRPCIEIPGANAAIHFIAFADEQTTTFSRRLLIRVRDQIGHDGS